MSCIVRDPHAGPVGQLAHDRDAVARTRGRVEILNATRPDGLDGWTMDLEQYTAMRGLVLELLDDAGPGGTVLLKHLVAAAQERYGAHPLFPLGRTRNYLTYTKVDLEARCEVERLPGSPQRVTRWRAEP